MDKEEHGERQKLGERGNEENKASRASAVITQQQGGNVKPLGLLDRKKRNGGGAKETEM